MFFRKLNKIARSCSCRACINKRYGYRLEPCDCIYHHFQSTCPICGEIRNIVVGFVPGRRWIITLKRLGRKKER